MMAVQTSMCHKQHTQQRPRTTGVPQDQTHGGTRERWHDAAVVSWQWCWRWRVLSADELQHRGRLGQQGSDNTGLFWSYHTHSWLHVLGRGNVLLGFSLIKAQVEPIIHHLDNMTRNPWPSRGFGEIKPEHREPALPSMCVAFTVPRVNESSCSLSYSLWLSRCYGEHLIELDIITVFLSRSSRNADFEVRSQL